MKDKSRRFKAARFHAKRRALERYNLYLTDSDYDEAIRKIKSGAGKLVRRQSVSRHLYWVEIQGKKMLAVYHPGGKHLSHNGLIRTFAPPSLADSPTRIESYYNKLNQKVARKRQVEKWEKEAGQRNRERAVDVIRRIK